MKRLLVVCMAMLAAFACFAQSPCELKKINGTMRLVQDGKPLLLLGAELHNSQSSTPVALESSLKTARAMGMNAVIATVSWEQLEPEEGKFDFSEIDDILRLSAKYDLKVCVAWFGTWKNGESSYAPLWLKRDTKRFFRARLADGTNSTTVSPLCEAACKADARAFGKLMEHIKTADIGRRVLLMQVENEVGTFADIDHSKAALQVFDADVPNALMQFLKKNEKTLNPKLLKAWTDNGRRSRGSWREVFGMGDDTKDFFMAYAYAAYVDKVAAAGKAAYDIPMYTNCWLTGENPLYGKFPNGGPRYKVLDIWKAGAPHLDWLSPDIYTNRYHQVLQQYHRPDNPIFIPETNREGGYAYPAFAEYNAMGYFPFGFEEKYDDPYFHAEYQTLGELLPVISEYQGTGRIHGFMRQEGVDKADDSLNLQIGDYIFTVKYIKEERRAHGLIIQTGDNEFIAAGVGAYIEVGSKDKRQTVKYGMVEEIENKDGAWNRLFVLNGDETNHNNMLYLRGRMPLCDTTVLGKKIEGPLYRPSFQRMHNTAWTSRFKYSGIYRFSLYSYPRQ